MSTDFSRASGNNSRDYHKPLMTERGTAMMNYLKTFSKLTEHVICLCSAEQGKTIQETILNFNYRPWDNYVEILDSFWTSGMALTAGINISLKRQTK